MALRCPVHALSGLHCPGCGIGRAFVHLLDGDVAAAFASNPLWPVVTVVVGRLAGEQLRALVAAAGMPAARGGRSAMSPSPAAVSALIAFAIARNVPVALFAPLAP